MLLKLRKLNNKYNYNIIYVGLGGGGGINLGHYVTYC